MRSCQPAQKWQRKSIKTNIRGPGQWLQCTPWLCRAPLSAENQYESDRSKTGLQHEHMGNLIGSSWRYQVAEAATAAGETAVCACEGSLPALRTSSSDHTST